MTDLEPGMRVRLRDNPTRTGTLGNEPEGSGRRLRLQVRFDDGTADHFPPSAIEGLTEVSNSPYTCIREGSYALASNLRATITHHRLSGRLANLIYSLNTTNTQYYPHQFKPVLQFLDSPSNGILIADEVGLGKTIEAGLIWTELRARTDARRLLVVCPAVLRMKWREELLNRFGIRAELVDAGELTDRLEQVRNQPRQDFALIASMQGLRPPRDYEELTNKQGAARLARLLDEIDPGGEPLINLLIVDEAHYLRNAGTQTNRLAKLLRPQAEHVVLLSATPIQLSDSDLFNLLNLLDESAFPNEYLFRSSMQVTSPIVKLRDDVISGRIDQKTFADAIAQAMANQYLEDSVQLSSLADELPSDQELQDRRTRAEIADRLDRLHPLSKLVTRTLKREVQENRVLRIPFDLRAKLSDIESKFYHQVTQRVRDYCEDNGLLTGFILTTPQRQMSSCMPAACRAWQQRLAQQKDFEPDEGLSELLEDEEAAANPPPALGTLVSQLVQIAQQVGDFEQLRLHDSKYRLLKQQLRKYFNEYPDKKVVLFSFFRHTLQYLAERLVEDGFTCVVMQGGSNKQDILKSFESESGPQILLSSEVGSEGIDLQFSSLLINYDLPWNPMRIEQRIGRIDRLGQQADRILIWNMMHRGTIDERIYDRLLDRLGIFKQALGSMEMVMGNPIKKMTKDLLSHNLTEEEEVQRIDQTLMAIVETERRQEQLEEEAPNLVAHGEFIINKVRAAQELGRFVRSEDIYAYVTDFLVANYPGTRFIAQDCTERLYTLEISARLRVELDLFIQANGLQGKSRMLSVSPPAIEFDNCYRAPSPTLERITQDHPLVRFVSYQLAQPENAVKRHPISAIRLSAMQTGGLAKGCYVFTVYRWSFSGAQVQERLVFSAQSLTTQRFLDAEEAELLVNNAALHGDNWLAASNALNYEQVQDAYDDCSQQIAKQFRDARRAMRDENADRINLMIQLVKKRCEQEVSRLEEQILRLHSEGKDRMIKPTRGRINKIYERTDQRVAELDLKKKLEAQNNYVVAGVVNVD